MHFVDRKDALLIYILSMSIRLELIWHTVLSFSHFKVSIFISMQVLCLVVSFYYPLYQNLSTCFFNICSKCLHKAMKNHADRSIILQFAYYISIDISYLKYVQADLFLFKQLATLINEAKTSETEAPKGGESSSGATRQVASPGVRGNASFGHRDMYSSNEPISMRGVVGSGSRSRKGSQ